MNDLYILKTLAVKMGGTLIDRSVGFSLETGDVYKLYSEGDQVILRQVWGRDKGQRCAIATLSELRKNSPMFS
jgi:hypothetical protein